MNDFQGPLAVVNLLMFPDIFVQVVYSMVNSLMILAAARNCIHNCCVFYQL